MQAQENLKRQYIENKMLQEQLTIMRQQRAMMEMQATQQKAPFHHKTKKLNRKKSSEY